MNKHFLLNIFKLSSSTGTAQIIQFLLIPFLVRLYGVEEFGIYSLILAISAVVTPISALRYDQAIVTDQSDSNAKTLFIISALFSLVSSILIGWLFFNCGQEFAHFFQLNLDLSIIWLLGPIAFSEALQEHLRLWLTRNGQFSSISIGQILRIGFIFGFQFYFGIFQTPTSESLIIGYVAGLSITTLILLALATKGLLAQKIIWKSTASILYRHRNFPLYSFPGSLVNSLSLQLPTFALSRFFGIEVVGYFALAQKVVRVPLGFIGNAISQVYFREASRLRSSKNLNELTQITFKGLFFLGAPLFILPINGANIFEVLFGEKWIIAAEYAGLLSPLFFLWLLSSPVSVLYSVFDCQKPLFFFQLSKLVFRGTALLIGGLNGSVTFTLCLLVTLGGFIQGIQGFYSYRLGRLGIKELKNSIFDFALLTSLFGLTLISSGLNYMPYLFSGWSNLAVIAIYYIWTAYRLYPKGNESK